MGNLLALGIRSKVGVVLLRVDASILSNVFNAPLEVAPIAAQVKPRPCSTNEDHVIALLVYNHYNDQQAAGSGHVYSPGHA